jgi:ATP-binding cassette subfamily F protein 3
VGYFSQHRAEMFKAGRTVFQEACDTPRALSETAIRTVLGSFLFQGDMVYKKVDVLSGGEKSRLGLARLLLNPPNLLLMDEPTTHLDVASVETLIEALKVFEGSICFISHDVYFLRQLADHVIHVNHGKITWYPGNYDYFLHKKALEESEEGELFRSEERIEQAHHRQAPVAPIPAIPSAAPTSGPDTISSGKKTKEQKRKEAEERNAKYKAKQEKKEIKAKREDLKEEEKDIMKQFANPKTHHNPELVAELAKRLSEIQKLLKEN